CGQGANEFPVLTQGSGQEGAPLVAASQCREIVLRTDIRDVQRAMLAHPTNMWRIDTDLNAVRGHGTKMSHRNQSVVLIESQHHVVNPANPCRALDDGIKDRLHVRRRTADDAEHLSRCGLMLQSLAKFCVALLDFLEQPHVLDGDDGLVDERFEKSDLLVGERANLKSANIDNPNGNTFTQQWNGQTGPNAQAMDGMPDIRPILFTFGPDVVSMNCLPIEYGPTARGATADRPGLADRSDRGDSSIACDFPLHVALDAPDLSINRLTEPRRILRHCIQNWLHVSG